MKKIKILSLLVLMVLLGGVLSGCTGGAGAVSSYPSISLDAANETVYLAAGAHIYSVNLANGAERWRYPEKADGKMLFYAPPILNEAGQLIAGSYDHKLYSLNPSNRSVNWSFTVASDVYVGHPLVTDKAIYAPNSDRTLYAVDQTGALLWKASASHALWSTPSADGKLIFEAGMDHHVYAFDQQNGKQVWKSEDLGGALVGDMALSPQGVLYIGTLGSQMAALDSTSGKTLWQTAAKGWVWADPLISGDLVIFSDMDGNVYAVDAASGSIKWQAQPDSGAKRAITAAPVVAGETLYFASNAGVLYAVDLATGNSSWNKTIGGKIYSDLALNGEKILIAPLEFEAALVAVDLQGNVSWSFTPAK